MYHTKFYAVKVIIPNNAVNHRVHREILINKEKPLIHGISLCSPAENSIEVDQSVLQLSAFGKTKYLKAMKRNPATTKTAAAWTH